ncbi:MAG: phage portal protein [Acidimicrobiales bacterium]
MSLLERVATERKGMSWHFGGGQGFVEPSFWSLDHLRHAFLSNSTPDRERIENDFEGYVEGAYKRDGIVFTCILTRQLVFSQARFRWTELTDGLPGPLFGSTDLALLEQPWVNATTADLLARMDVDLSLAGNFYATVADDNGRLGRAATGPGRRISHLRPDWVTIVISSRSGDPRAADARAVGYLYEPPPTGAGARSDPVLLMPGEVCHYRSVTVDPVASWRGMSWLTPILREVSADRAATSHKLKFFENNATLGTVVSLDKDIGVDAFQEFVRLFKETHRGTEDAYETLFLGGGADVTVVGTDLKQLDFKATQGATETRIAAASGVGAIVAQFSEGMQGSSLNAGNYMAARRRTADILFRSLWDSAAGSLRPLVTPPRPSAVLWPDLRGVWFLQEDAKDAADIFAVDAQAIRALTDGGYEPASILDATAARDVTKLRHTGKTSVQLQPPMEQGALPAASTNGNGRALEEV